MNNLSRWTKVLGVVLVLSLALNFFLAGWMGARFMHGDVLPHRWSITRLVHDLPEDQRAAVVATFERHRDEIRDAMDNLRETRREVADILIEEPYDPKATAAALASLRAQSAAMQETMHDALLEVAAQLPPEARLDLGRFATMSRMQ